MSLITDRTAADAQNGTAKGRYNAVDLNRVESAVASLATEMQGAESTLQTYAANKGVAWDSYYAPPYTFPQLTTKTNWKTTDIPKASTMSRYLGNVRTIAEDLEVIVSGFPSSMDKLTYQGANAIEQALELSQTAQSVMMDVRVGRIDRAAAAWYYAGDLYAGEI